MTEITLTGLLINKDIKNGMIRRKKTFNWDDILKTPIGIKYLTELNLDCLNKAKQTKTSDYILYINTNCYWRIDILTKFFLSLRDKVIGKNDKGELIFDKDKLGKVKKIMDIKVNLKGEYKENMFKLGMDIIEDINHSSSYSVPEHLSKKDDEFETNETCYTHLGFIEYKPKGEFEGDSGIVPFENCKYPSNIISFGLYNELSNETMQEFIYSYLKPFIKKSKSEGNDEYDNIEKSKFFNSEIVYINLIYPDGSKYNSNNVIDLGTLICINIKKCNNDEFDIFEIVKQIIKFNSISFDIPEFYKHLKSYYSGHPDYPNNDRLWISNIVLVNHLRIGSSITSYDKKNFNEEDLKNVNENNITNWIDYLYVKNELTIENVKSNSFYLCNKLRYKKERLYNDICGIEEMTIIDKSNYIEPEPEHELAPVSEPEPELAPELAPVSEPEPEYDEVENLTKSFKTVAIDSDENID